MYDIAPRDFGGLTKLKLERRTAIKNLFHKTKSSLSLKRRMFYSMVLLWEKLVILKSY
jgi:hypothetical protein